MRKKTGNAGGKIPYLAAAVQNFAGTCVRQSGCLSQNFSVTKNLGVQCSSGCSNFVSVRAGGGAGGGARFASLQICFRMGGQKNLGAWCRCCCSGIIAEKKKDPRRYVQLTNVFKRPYRSRVGVCVCACVRARAWARALGSAGGQSCVRARRSDMDRIKPGRIRSGRIGSGRVEGRGSSENGSRHVRPDRRGLVRIGGLHQIVLIGSASSTDYPALRVPPGGNQVDGLPPVAISHRSRKK